MEVYQERSWIGVGDDSKISKRASYDHHRILPSRLIAEYCVDAASTIARIWASYREPETPELETNPTPIVYDDSALRWVASNSKMLYRLYPEKWILVGDGRVIADSEDPNELLLIAEAQAIEAPFITRVAQPTKHKTTVYAK
jgi:Family of unknown function (DUF5678)